VIALSTAEPVRFTPPFMAGNADAPVFLIRPGSVVERAQLEAVLSAPPYNAGRVMPWDLADAASDAARALLLGDDLGQVLDALAAMKASFGLAELPLEQRQLLIGIDESLTAHWPEYAALRQQESRRDELMPLLACQRFLVGWENVEAPFTRGKDGRVSEDSLRALGAFLPRLIGHECYRLLYAEDQRPLSPPPSKSGPGPVISPAGGVPRLAAKAGSSRGNSGKKIRG
jgi:hypothetical protein